MKRFAIVLLAIIFSSGWKAAAEPVVVRTGEHPAFTRMVIQLPEASEWSLENESGLSRLILKNFNAGFDLSQAFEIIPRTRLTALLARESVLEMQLACDCPVTAFAERNGVLVIDILDGPALVENIDVPVPSSSIPQSQFAFGELLWNDTMPSIPPAQSVSPDRTNEPAIEQSIVPSAQKEADHILETQRRLLEAFAGAASQGVLDIIEPDLADVSEVDNKSKQPEIFDSSTLEVEEETPITSNIRVTSSNDVPTLGNTENLAMSGSSCPDPSIVNVAEWGSDSPIHLQLGPLTQELYDDLGRLDPENAIMLSKLYIHFGFGAEATHILSLQPDLEISHPELVDIANILERGFANNPRTLHRFADCNSDLALWGILVADEVPEENAIDAKAALRALNKLPSHLRFFLGQELSQRLIQRGDLENADLALRSYGDLLENEGKPPKIGEAQALLLKGEEQAASQALNEIIEEDTSDAPEAIIALIDEKIEDGQSVPADMALLAEAYAFELKDMPIGEDMFRAFVRATTSSKQFGKSFTALSDETSPADERMRSELTNQLFKTIAAQADDVQFLQIFFNDFNKYRDVVGPDERLDLAQRLFSMGFIPEATTLADGLQGTSRPDELRLLRSKILLHNDAFEASLAQLDGLSGEDALKTQARALENIGQNAAAAENFYAADMPERAATSLWLSESWAELLEPNTPVYGAIVELESSATPEITPNSEMLSSSEAAIEASSEVRSNLEEFLEALEVSIE